MVFYTQVTQFHSEEGFSVTKNNSIVHHNEDKNHVKEFQHQQGPVDSLYYLSKSKPLLQTAKRYHSSLVPFFVQNESQSDIESKPAPLVLSSQQKRKENPKTKCFSKDKRGFSQKQKEQHKQTTVATHDWPSGRETGYVYRVLAGMERSN